MTTLAFLINSNGGIEALILKGAGSAMRQSFALGSNPVNIETFEKCSILFKFKKDEDFNHRHTLSIPRIKI